MYPLQVDVNEQSIARLTDTFEKAYKSILSEITTATDFGVANRKALLAQIEATLESLGVDTQAFIEKELKEQYQLGADDAVKQLKNVGADVNVAEGFNRIHTNQIAALVDDASRAFGESMTGVNRSAQLLLGRVSRETLTQKLAEGLIGGKARREVNNIIKATIAEQGLPALIDKGGHTWTLDRYADMLFRTKAVEARNRGLINRMVENDYDLVQVSNHNSSHRECAEWEGKILSATGASRGYPTIADAERDGLFHPNCKHAINVLIPSLAKLTKAYNPNEETEYVDPDKVKRATAKKAAPPAPKQATPQKTMTFVGQEIKLNNLESKIAEQTNLKIIALQGRTANRVYGQYNPNFNTIGYGKATATRSAAHNKQTFYHEVGHMIDNHALPKDIVQRTYGNVPTNHEIANFLSKKPEFIEAIAPYKYDIIETRLKRGNDNWQKLDKEAVKTVILGGKIPIEGTTNRYYYLTPAHRKYMRSASEMFAEAYGQYRTEPALTKKTMPKLFEYFEKLGGDK